ncbi:MAG: hypothetical protein KKD28_12545 [Chloroflexi bacterium]|nr:hypothetical protein [Chloroflexota bacterium]MBU1662287.1 hypothetical protein [Chloroflexota bacterium]
MEAYKFDTTIRENGVIQIPEIAKFASHQVEIFILVKPKPQLATGKPQTMSNFLAKWRGFLKGFDPDEMKYQYLQIKM